ncbi:hypothetical protein INR49_026139 [Caranx melampygus]|nr:hypothetical protein INR49_026139 [Caranx melampygus]
MSDQGMSCSVFDELRLQGIFCDTVLKAEDVEFQVHKIVLCNCSPYFRALFTRWQTPDCRISTIPGVSPKMLQQIIQFAYTGSVSVTEDNVQELMMAANQFNITDIVQTCSSFISDRLSPENCIGVRLALTNVDYLRVHMLSNTLVRNNDECLQMTVAAFETLYHIITNGPPVPSFRNPQARPRLPNAILLAIGGWSGSDPTNGMEAYDFKADRWLNVTNDMELPRAYHGTAFLGGYVYCVGGFDRVEHFNSMRRFDLTTNSWQEVAPMYYRRCYVSVTVLNGYIYAMGGYNGHNRLSSAERYNPETNQWNLIAHMNEQRSDASCTVLHGRIYICGGFNGNECLHTAEYYSPESNQWTVITPMSSRRSGIGVIAYEDHVFAVGGFDGSARLQTAEAYNPQTDSWHSAAQMLTPRSNFGIEVIDGRLFAVGGFNGFNTSYKVEYYDAARDQWTSACGMEIYRSALSCCVVYGLPNLSTYAYPRDNLPFFQLENEDIPGSVMSSPPKSLMLRSGNTGTSLKQDTQNSLRMGT